MHGRRSFFTRLVLGAGAVVGGFLPATVAPAPIGAPWSDTWPPTARRGKLIRCDAAPGYFTVDGIAALAIIPDDAYADAVTGPTGWPRDREFDPPWGTHVIEINIDQSRDQHLDHRYAVVR